MAARFVPMRPMLAKQDEAHASNQGPVPERSDYLMSSCLKMKDGHFHKNSPCSNSIAVQQPGRHDVEILFFAWLIKMINLQYHFSLILQPYDLVILDAAGLSHRPVKQQHLGARRHRPEHPSRTQCSNPTLPRTRQVILKHVETTFEVKKVI